jgi:hypothetical protein
MTLSREQSLATGFYSLLETPIGTLTQCLAMQKPTENHWIKERILKVRFHDQMAAGDANSSPLI